MKEGCRLAALAACIAAVALFAMLVGCSSASDSSTRNPEGFSANASKGDSPGAQPSSDEVVELKVCADGSFARALDEAQTLYSEQNPGVSFAEARYSGAADLARAAEAGEVDADVVITASEDAMSAAVDLGLADASTQEPLLSSDLVIVASARNDELETLTLDELAEGAHSVYTVNVGEPVGDYSSQALDSVVYQIVETSLPIPYSGTPLERKVSVVDSAETACEFVEAGEADVAIMFAADLERFGGLKAVGRIPNEVHDDIVFPAAVGATSQHSEEARAFIEWCATDAAVQDVWKKWGLELAS